MLAAPAKTSFPLRKSTAMVVMDIFALFAPAQGKPFGEPGTTRHELGGDAMGAGETLESVQNSTNS